MMRCVLLAALCLALGAGEDPFAGTPLRWEAGPATLAQAVARLQAGGNRVLLADGLDDRASAELPAVAGVWWDGVVAICAAWNLRPDAGEPAVLDRGQFDDSSLPVGHGPLLLLPGPTPGLQVCDGLLASIDADQARLRVRLRAEPRVPRGAIGWGQASPASLSPSEEGSLIDAGLAADRLALEWRLAKAVRPGARLALEVRVAQREGWQRETELTAGQDVKLQVGESELVAALITDKEQAEWQGEQIGERRPLLVIAGPGDLLGAMRVEMLVDGAGLGSRGGGMRNTNGRAVLFRYLRALPEGRLTLALAGRMDGPLRPLALDLPLPTPPGPAGRPVEAPSRFAGAAGTAPLSRWLQLLAATGNPVLPEVGLDISAPVVMPAVDGTYWDGVLALCRAAGLAPAIAPEAGIADGALRLVRRPLPPTAACGPVLVLAERLATDAGQMALRLRFVVEPRLPAETFRDPDVAWASWAMDETGTPHPLTAQPGASGGEAQILRINGAGNAVVLQAGGNLRSRQGQALPHLSVALARAEAQTLTLSGLLRLTRARQMHGTAVLTPGKPAELPLSDRVVEITALAIPTRIDGQMYGAGLLVRGLHGFENVRHVVTPMGGDGAPESGLTSGRSTSTFEPRLIPCLIPAQGEVEVRLEVSTETPPLLLPLRIEVPVADGL